MGGIRIVFLVFTLPTVTPQVLVLSQYVFQCRASVEDCESTLKQNWVNATCSRKVYSRPSDGLVLGQRHRRLTGIEFGG